jgi:hypothetical protein
MTRKLMLEHAVDEVIAQAQACYQLRQSGNWANVETQVAFADFLFEQNDLAELVRDLQDETVDHLAEAVAHDFDMLGCDGAFRLRKLMLSRVDWKQLAARLLSWAGVELPAPTSAPSEEGGRP